MAEPYADVAELQNLFLQAAEFVRTLRDLKNENKLNFYGLFKQANEGPCKTRKPPIWDMRSGAKWEAWKNLGSMSKEAAMKNYINELTRLNENWEQISAICTEVEEKSLGGESRGISGVSVSTLYNAEYEEEQKLKDENKTVFDWCKEGNTQQLMKLVQSNNVNVDIKDEQGMTLLHWASDRGYLDIVQYLINTNSDVNIQDEDGQTPLHYAVICEFESIVQALLYAGANTSLTDNDGNIPSSLTTHPQLVHLFSAAR